MSDDPELPPAGWYPDVEVPGGERYWDGQAWTEHRRPGTEGWAAGPAAAGSSDTGADVGATPAWGSGGAGWAGGSGRADGSGAGSAPAWGSGPAWSSPAAELDTWLWQSIVATILCCLPLGIAGIVFAAQAGSARDAGNLDVARQRAAQARTWTLWSVGVGVAFYLGLFGLGAAGALLGV